eukprot:9488530-Pyramimonas_sp.AAC.1
MKQRLNRGGAGGGWGKWMRMRRRSRRPRESVARGCQGEPIRMSSAYMKITLKAVVMIRVRV